MSPRSTFLARRLASAAEELAQHLGSRAEGGAPLDVDDQTTMVELMRAALESMAKSLDGLADALDPDGTMDGPPLTLNYTARRLRDALPPLEQAKNRLGPV